MSDAGPEIATEPPPQPAGFMRRHGVKTFASLAIAGLFVWLLMRAGLPIVPDAAAMAHVRWPYVGAHLAILMTYHLLRALRWRHLLRPLAPDISNRKIVAASWLGFTAILILPLRAGEIVRPWLIRDRKRITLSAALGTMGAERVIDGLVVTVALAIALLFVPRLDPLPKTFGDLNIPVAAIPTAGFVALAIFVSAFAAMAVFYFARDFAVRVVHGTVGRVSEKLAIRIAGIVAGLAAGLHFLADRRHGLPFVLETLLYWACVAFGMWILGIGCGLPMTFGHAIAVMGVLAVGILVPAGPGLFGAFQASCYGGLAMYFPPGSVVQQGAAFVFLLYVVQFIWHLVAAVIGAILDPSLVKKSEESVDADVLGTAP